MSIKNIEIPAAIIKIETFGTYKKLTINGVDIEDYILKLVEKELEPNKNYVLYHSSENFLIDPNKINIFGGKK